MSSRPHHMAYYYVTSVGVRRSSTDAVVRDINSRSTVAGYRRARTIGHLNYIAVYSPLNTIFLLYLIKFKFFNSKNTQALFIVY